MKQVDAAAKPKILQYMTLPAMNLFRWSALITVLVGFWYWSQVYVAAAAQRDGGSAGATIGLFLLIWIVVWGIFYALVLRTPNPWLLAAIVAVLVIVGAWLFVRFIPVGGDDNHVISIGIGGGFGIVMLFNVWGIIWRNNKKIIQGTLAGTPPADAATLARQAFFASRTNAYLSIPLLFFMGASSHYPLFGK